MNWIFAMTLFYVTICSPFFPPGFTPVLRRPFKQFFLTLKITFLLNFLLYHYPSRNIMIPFLQPNLQVAENWNEKKIIKMQLIYGSKFMWSSPLVEVKQLPNTPFRHVLPILIMNTITILSSSQVLNLMLPFYSLKLMKAPPLFLLFTCKYSLIPPPLLSDSQAQTGIYKSHEEVSKASGIQLVIVW